MSDIERSFGTAVRHLRRDMRLNQTELAQRMTVSGVPFTQPLLSRIESGDRGVGLTEAICIAEVLGVPFASLLQPETLTQDERTQAIDRAKVKREASEALAHLSLVLDYLETPTTQERHAD